MRFLILFIFLFLTYTVAAQDFKPAFLINNEKSIIEGYIDYVNVNRCYFKSDLEGEVVSFGPGDIYGFQFKGDKFFISKSVLNSDSTKSEIFLEVKIKGKLSLYIKDNRLFIEKDSIFTEVKNAKINKPGNNQAHLGILNSLTSDCNQFIVRDQKPTLKYFTDIVIQYNKCIDAQYLIYKKNRKWTESEFSLSIGFNFSNLSFKNNNQHNEYAHLTDDSFFSPANFMVGLTYNFKSPRISENLSLQTELIYSKFEFTNYVVDRVDFETIIHENTFIDLNYLNSNIGIRYEFFPYQEINIFLNGGLSFLYHINKNSLHRLDEETNKIISSEYKNALNMKNMQYGYWTGLGIKLSIRNIKTSLEVRSDFLKGLPQIENRKSSGLKSNIMSHSLLLSIYY